MTHFNSSVTLRSLLSSGTYRRLCLVGSPRGLGRTSARAGVLPEGWKRHSAYSLLSMKSRKTLAAFGWGAPFTTAKSGELVVTQPGSRHIFVIGTVPRLYS